MDHAEHGPGLVTYQKHMCTKFALHQLTTVAYCVPPFLKETTISTSLSPLYLDIT